MCVRERERVCVCERERECVCECLCVCVCTAMYVVEEVHCNPINVNHIIGANNYDEKYLPDTKWLLLYHLETVTDILPAV